MMIFRILLILSLLFPVTSQAEKGPIVPEVLVKRAVDYWRDDSSFTKARMTIHRPDWERSLAMESWTKGSSKALVRFTSPAKDAGSATLSLGDETWSYSPKINRVIKIPPSMKAQSWMGSDFSYRDLTKADDIVKQYTHVLIKQDSVEGKILYTVESTPKENAPVVWGKEILQIREDLVIMRHEFYDQDKKLVKVLEAKEIASMGGKLFPKVMRMTKVEEDNNWTEIFHDYVEFKKEFSDSFFSVGSLSGRS
jgi:outer membrane lipoprotein-sorting protein